MEIVSVSNQKYVTTNIIIPLFIYITFSVILFLCKFQLLRKLFYIGDLIYTH